MRTSAFHELGDVHIRMLAGPGPPFQKTGIEPDIARGQRAIHHQQPLKTSGHVYGQGQAEQRTPVLAHERHGAEVKPLNEPHEGIAMKSEGVNGIVDRFVGTPEAKVVRRDNAVARLGEHRDHPAIQIAPGGFAVQAEKHLRRVARAFIDIMKAQALVARQILHIVGRIGETRKVLEAFVRGA